jgi:hypothetical protein
MVGPLDDERLDPQWRKLQLATSLRRLNEKPAQIESAQAAQLT